MDYYTSIRKLPSKKAQAHKANLISLNNDHYKYIDRNKITFDNIIFDDSYKQITHGDLCMFCHQNPNKIFNVKTLQNLKQFVSSHSDSEIKSMLLSTNQSYGFTYLHYLFFSFAKERLRHRNPAFALEAPNMIKFLASYNLELFVRLLKVGKVDTTNTTNTDITENKDLSNCTPFHDYVKNLSYAKPCDIEFIEYMRDEKFDLDFDNLKDFDGFSYNDYIQKKNNVTSELADKIRHIQGKMKQVEKTILDKITNCLPTYFKKCAICNKMQNLIEDLYTIPSKRLISKINHQDILQILKIIGMRESICKLFDENNSSTQDNMISHQNMISSWKIHIAYIIKNT
jgi:hypothetical protein